MFRFRTGLACAVLVVVGATYADTFLGRSLDEWLTVLSGAKTAKARRGAAFALGRMGAEGGPAVATLARRMRDDSDASVRDMAAQAIGEIVLVLRSASSAWEVAGSILVQRCKAEPDPRVRRSVVYALGAFGPAAKGAVQELRDALGDAAAPVRQNAAWALGRIVGEGDSASLRALSKRLSDESPLVRRDAAQALGQIAKRAGRKVTADTGPALIAMAASEPDPVVCKAALAALANVATPDHSRQAAALHKLIDDKDPEIARAAAFALVAVGEGHAEKAMPALREALKDDDPEIQALAAAAFFQLGPKGQFAAADLAKLLTKSPDPKVRHRCIISLGSFKAHAAEAVPVLAHALKPRKTIRPGEQEMEEEVRHMAAEALSHISYPVNKPALPAILNAIARDTNQNVRLRCVEALFNVPDLNTDGIARTLIGVLDETGGNDQVMLVRYNCARLLAKGFGANAPDKAVKVLLHMLDNRRIKVFYETGAKVDGGTTEGTKGSTKVAERTGGDARFMAAEALGMMGTKNKDNLTVVDALRKAAKDEDPMLKKQAKEALSKIGVGE